MAALAALRSVVNSLHESHRQQLKELGEVSVAVREPAVCPDCGVAMKVEKTVRRHGRTLSHGVFEARETVFVCRSGCRRGGELVRARSAQLENLLMPLSTIGYDVMVYVGCQRFIHHRQRDEIRQQLESQYGISVSTGEISSLAKRFLDYLEKLHWQSAPALRAAFEADGGWPLHVDATGENGRGTVVTLLAGWRGWVLDAWKAPTERAEFVLPGIRKAAETFGTPCAIMRDLGRAMTEAANEFVQTLDKPIPVLACHQHFLADIGKDLLDDGHNQLRGLFRKIRLQPKLRHFVRQLGTRLGASIEEGRETMNRWLEQLTDPDSIPPIPDGIGGITFVRGLAQWVLDFHDDGGTKGFPYNQPWLDLYTRCVHASEAVATFLRTPPNDDAVAKALQKLKHILEPIEMDDPPMLAVGKALLKRVDLFSRLRNALRLEDGEKDSVRKLNDVQKALERLTAALQKERPQRGPAKDIRQAIDIILTHLKSHGAYLSGHVINTPGIEDGVRLVARTNNILEGQFHTIKHGERRRSGRKILTRDFEDLPAAAVLATNLCHYDYVKLVCGSLDQLPLAFARLDLQNRTAPIARNPAPDIARIESASLSTADKNIIRQPIFESRVLAAAEVS
jgi:hypothetical protein